MHHFSLPGEHIWYFKIQGVDTSRNLVVLCSVPPLPTPSILYLLRIKSRAHILLSLFFWFYFVFGAGD